MSTTSSSTTSSSSCQGCPEGSSDSEARSERKNDVIRNLGSHTWQFPPLEVARMLSPKKPKPHVEAAGKILLLDQYDCVVDTSAFQNALDYAATHLQNDAILTSQSFDLDELAAFFSRSVEVCHDALDRQQDSPLRWGRWYKDLQFTVWDALADNSVESISLKPPIVGGPRFSAGDGMLSESRPTNELALPVEVGRSWEDIVSRAYEDARGLFAAGRIRTFALVLGFNQDEKAFRFLIFHPGGLTSSQSCYITAPGQKEIACLFLALASWSTPEEAGFISSFTNAEYALPADESGENTVIAEVEEVLSCSTHIPGRVTRVTRARLPQDSPAEGGLSHCAQCSNDALTLTQAGRFDHSWQKNTTKSTNEKDGIAGETKRKVGRVREH